MGDPLGRWTASFYPTAFDKRTSRETSIVSVVIDFVNELLGKLLTSKSDPRYSLAVMEKVLHGVAVKPCQLCLID